MKTFTLFILCVMQSFTITLIQLPLMAIGLFAVPLALMFRIYDTSVIPEVKNGWVMIRLPKWAWIWDNDWDGAMGDDNMRYWDRDYPKIFKNSPLLKMWYWLAVRNKINNSSRYWFGCDVSKNKPILIAGDYTVQDKRGKEGWQLVKAGWCIGFYWVRKGVTEKNWVSRMGFKIQPSHATTDWSKDPKDALKNLTFKPLLYKSV